MKQLACEMCGGTDLIKQDGVFVCQNCGIKYSLEDAKKMMIEGSVDVSGSTIKVDTSDELANLYQIARRAKDDNNGENAAKYYDMILVKDPVSWEASFFVVYFNALNCKIAQIHSAAISIFNCQDSVLKLIRDHVSDEAEQIRAVTEVALRSKIAASLLSNGAKKHYDGISSDIKSNYTQEWLNNACASRDIDYNMGDQIDAFFHGNEVMMVLAEDAWKTGISKHKALLPELGNKDGNLEVIIEYSKKIQSNTEYKSTEDTLSAAYDELIKDNEDGLLAAAGIYSALNDEYSATAEASLGLAVCYMRLGFSESSVLVQTAAAKGCYEARKESNNIEAYNEYAKKIINMQNSNGFTLLMLACARLISVDIVKYLVDSGADVNIMSKRSVTALWFICYEAHSIPQEKNTAIEIAKILLENGADTNITNRGNVSLLNDKTDPEIRQLILSSRPDTKTGASANSVKSGGCYVATAVYGSYDCPQVWTLRRYRDYTLAETWHGRAFIHTYYAISPTLVKWFGNTNWFKKLWKGKLDRMVESLKADGVKDTPYQDRNW